MTTYDVKAVSRPRLPLAHQVPLESKEVKRFTLYVVQFAFIALCAYTVAEVYLTSLSRWSWLANLTGLNEDTIRGVLATPFRMMHFLGALAGALFWIYQKKKGLVFTIFTALLIFIFANISLGPLPPLGWFGGIAGMLLFWLLTLPTIMLAYGAMSGSEARVFGASAFLIILLRFSPTELSHPPEIKLFVLVFSVIALGPFVARYEQAFRRFGDEMSMEQQQNFFRIMIWQFVAYLVILWAVIIVINRLLIDVPRFYPDLFPRVSRSLVLTTPLGIGEWLIFIVLVLAFFRSQKAGLTWFRNGRKSFHEWRVNRARKRAEKYGEEQRVIGEEMNVDDLLALEPT